MEYNRRFDTHRSSLAHVVSETLVGWIAPAQDRLVGASASDSGQLCDQPSPPTTSTSDDFCVFPTPMRAACAQVWLVPTSTRALRPLERAVAARQVAARHRRPRAAAAKSRFLRFCRVCQTPCSPCAYRIARSQRSAVPYTTWTKRRQRAGQPRGMSGSFLRSQSCDIPRMAVFCRKSATIYSNLKKNARPAVFLNRTHQLYNTLGSQGQPKTFDFWIED